MNFNQLLNDKFKKCYQLNDQLEAIVDEVKNITEALSKYENQSEEIRKLNDKAVFKLMLQKEKIVTELSSMKVSKENVFLEIAKIDLPNMSIYNSQ